MKSSYSEKKTAQCLLLAYCLFIAYGSFIPFHFNFDPHFVRWRWSIFLTESIHGRMMRASLSDVLSNILLFLPFGILCVWVETAKDQCRRKLLSILLTTIYGLVFGVIIESGQTLSPWRSPSQLDVLCNGIGTFFGALGGLALVRAFRESLRIGLVQILRDQPSLLLLGYLLLGVLIDSYYPFGVTLARSTLWSNLKQSEFVPFKMFLHRYWLELLIEKMAIFAAIGYLILINLQRRWRIGAGLAWLLCSAVACAIEIGKLFFAARAFYSDNVIMASLGGLLGIVLLPGLSALSPVKRHREIIWFMLVLGFLVYFELSPFDWISPSELTDRFSRIEWLPFKAYYATEPLIALFDLQKKIYSLIPLGFVVMSLGPVQHTDSPRRKATMLCTAIAAAIELAQVAIRSRTPSTTDVIIFTASAWVGIVVFEGYRSFRKDNDVSQEVV
jgi:glycopeptide antibiotics resistance protein